MSYLNNDADVISCPHDCEASKLRVWIEVDICGAGQRLIGYFQKYKVAGTLNVFSCRGFIGEIL